MYGATEELWFPEWNSKDAVDHKPCLALVSAHFAGNSHPTLVTAGIDYRFLHKVQLYTAATPHAVKLLMFPDKVTGY